MESVDIKDNLEKLKWYSDVLYIKYHCTVYLRLMSWLFICD